MAKADILCQHIHELDILFDCTHTFVTDVLFQN